MSDYRPRNQDFLALGHERENLGWSGVAIFGAIGFTMMLLVGAYLTDSYNPASTGFSAAIPAPAARATALGALRTSAAAPDGGRPGPAVSGTPPAVLPQGRPRPQEAAGTLATWRGAFAARKRCITRRRRRR